MTDASPATPPRRRWIRYSIATLAVTAALAYGAFRIVQHQSDGPLTDIVPGGPLRTGTLVTAQDIDWQAELGGAGQCLDGECSNTIAELQLVDPPLSRYTGVMVHEGTLYVPCDLGYMWGRFSGSRRRILNLIYVFKTWHEDALADGRAVLRIDGKRYERQAVRVTDPATITALEHQLEEMASAWVAPEPLPPAPTDGPRDIWFFRMDPRVET